MAYSTIFPAPGTLIDSAGKTNNLTGLPAPGFAGLNIKANQPVRVVRARSSRGLPISGSSFFWSFDISYHEMTVEEYEAIENFLLGHNTKVNPFYITLPNYAQPRPSGYETFLNGADLSIDSTVYAGDKTITVNSTNASLLPGCFLNIDDDSDALHKGTYKVTRVETPTNFSGDPVAANKLRLSLFPEVQRDQVGTITARLVNPTFRVIQTGDTQAEYSQNNTVSFGFSCAEILP